MVFSILAYMLFGCAPNAIITDQDNAMQKAIEVVFRMHDTSDVCGIQ